MKKIIVFGKHYEKINSVFGKRPNISLALCSEFLARLKKKLIEGPLLLKVVLVRYYDRQFNTKNNNLFTTQNFIQGLRYISNNFSNDYSI